MRALTKNQRLVISALALELKETGMPPTHPRLVELCPTVPKGSIFSTVSALARRGFVEKSAYNNSPIKPLMDATGEPITIHVEWANAPKSTPADGSNQ